MRTLPALILAATAFLGVALIGCDDQESGGDPHKAAKHGAATAGRVGFGWRSTSETRVSAWTFVTAVAPAPRPDPLAGIRAALDANTLPPHDTVRVADLVGEGIADGAPPEGATDHVARVLLTTTPWNDDTLLLWVAVSGETIAAGQSVSVEFDPKSVTAFRPLGDPQNLAMPSGAVGESALLYELTAIQDEHPRADRRYATIHLGVARGRAADGQPAQKIDVPVTEANLVDTIDDAPSAVRFAAAIAGFAELLRGDPAVRDLSCGDVISLAESADQPDPTGVRAQLIGLMRRAQPLIDLPQGDPGPSTLADQPH